MDGVVALPPETGKAHWIIRRAIDMGLRFRVCDKGCKMQDARYMMQDGLSGHYYIEFVEGAGFGLADVHGELDPGGEQVGNVHGHGGEVFV